MKLVVDQYVLDLFHPAKLSEENMYIANHAYSVVGKPLEEGQKEIQELLDHASQDKYLCSVEWHDPGDLVKSPNRLRRASSYSDESSDLG